MFSQHMMEMIFGKKDEFTSLFFETDFSSFFNKNQEEIEDFFKVFEFYPLKVNIDVKNCKNILELLLQI